MNIVKSASSFYPHGEYSIFVRKAYLLVHASGAWNAEAKHAVHCEIISTLNRLKRSNWNLLVDISEFELGTPDFQQIGLIGKRRLLELGLQRVAYINRGTKQAGYRQIQAMQPNSSMYSWRLFDSASNAERWISNCDGMKTGPSIC